MNEESYERLMRFLLVEDDDDHAKIVSRTLVKERMANRIDRVKDGVEAIDFLKHQNKFKEAPTPDIILLDLKLPKKDGLEVLREIKSDQSLCSIPVVILTTSDNEVDKLKAYRGHANSYLVKPLDANYFKKMIEELNMYWGVWNRAPGRGVQNQTSIGGSKWNPPL